jgi:hypothetical protein
MSLHLFELQDKNLTWASLCSKERSDEMDELKSSFSNLQTKSINDLYRPPLIDAKTLTDLPISRQNCSNKQNSSYISYLYKTQPIINSYLKMDNHSNRRYTNIIDFIT